MNEITFYNFDVQNGISINYPLLYLHGTVTSDDITKINCKTRTSSVANDWHVKEREFKVFVELNDGDNEVVLTFSDGSESTIQANYTKNTNKRYVQPVYIICKNSDGHFIAPDGVENTPDVAVKKIQLNSRLMQTYFSESLYEHGFDRRTFQYAEDDDKKPLVKIVNSELEIDKVKEMSRDELYSTFRKELYKVLGEEEKRKLLVFMSCTRYNPPENADKFSVKDIQSYATGHAALGGGDQALFGTGSLHTWAIDLSELNTKFTDATLIDRMKLFDDSCGRGTYMANYATTLGATIHELGHAFDLAHTSRGIMCRGHDDMNFFYIVTEACKTQTRANDFAFPETKESRYKYRGAHWFRSSAVILYHNKWFHETSPEETAIQSISKSLHPCLIGPMGNSGPWCQVGQVSFNSGLWLVENNLSLLGFVFHHDEYVNALQFVGRKNEIQDGDVEECTGEKIYSDLYGTKDEETDKKTEFYINGKDEVITEIKICSGAYIDGLEITTNQKCSGWIGGEGGDLNIFKFDENRCIQGVVGTAGRYVGSVGIVVKRETTESDDAGNRCSSDVDIEDTTRDRVSFSSENGICLIETYLDDGEVKTYEEFIEDPPKVITKRLGEMGAVGNEPVNGMIYDNKGERLSFFISKFEKELIAQLT